MSADVEEMAALVRAGVDGPIPQASGERVAVIGAGPLSAAHDLALMRFRPVVFDTERTPAGMYDAPNKATVGTALGRFGCNLVGAPSAVWRAALRILYSKSLLFELRLGSDKSENLNTQALRLSRQRAFSLVKSGWLDVS